MGSQLSPNHLGREWAELPEDVSALGDLGCDLPHLQGVTLPSVSSQSAASPSPLPHLCVHDDRCSTPPATPPL